MTTPASLPCFRLLLPRSCHANLRVEVKRDWVPYLNSGSSNDRTDAGKDALKEHRRQPISSAFP